MKPHLIKKYLLGTALIFGIALTTIIPSNPASAEKLSSQPARIMTIQGWEREGMSMHRLERKERRLQEKRAILEEKKSALREQEKALIEQEKVLRDQKRSMQRRQSYSHERSVPSPEQRKNAPLHQLLDRVLE